jgi:hypothetical protein
MDMCRHTATPKGSKATLRAAIPLKKPNAEHLSKSCFLRNVPSNLAKASCQPVSTDPSTYTDASTRGRCITGCNLHVKGSPKVDEGEWQQGQNEIVQP